MKKKWSSAVLFNNAGVTMSSFPLSGRHKCDVGIKILAITNNYP